MLSELEDNDIGFTMCNGDIVSEEKYVGWINQILGTNYSFRKRFNLWENVEWYIENEKCEEMHISMKELFELIPKNLRYAAGGTELADLLWVINGTSSLLPRDLDPDSYAYEVWKCQRAIQEIFIKDLENEEEKILSLLQMPRNRRKSVMDPIMKKLAKFTLFLPARIVLFLYTEFTGDNFWEIWSAIKSGAYHDEKMKKYASKELELYRKIFIEGPIAPVTTSDFLSQDGYFTFWETPSELVGEENYYISDWDRLYWWGKIEDVEITEEIDIWLNMLVKEYEMILKGKEQETENAFVDHIFNTMEYLNSFYGRIYLFKEFYNALLNNSHEVRYQAILQKFSVENFKGFKEKITLDIGSPNNYNFNSELIEKGCVTKGIIYGINSCGKSNLGLAIFDLITHLTEKEKLLRSYDFYLNMSGRKSFAEFEYTFVFDSHEVIYHYCKTDVNTLKMESLSIDGKEVIYYDFLSRDGFTLLEGSDTLNASIKNESPISRVKYVNNNSILTDTEENHVFKKFINFVDHMLLFYSLDSRGYEGFMNGSESIAEGIVNSGKVKDFENFMRENGIEYNIGISGWNKHHLFLSMSLTHFIILSFLSQCKKDLEKFQGYRYLLQRTIQI